MIHLITRPEPVFPQRPPQNPLLTSSPPPGAADRRWVCLLKSFPKQLLHPDWSGAVWAGEAFVARYRLVQLEVPGWARAVRLLVQPVGWQAAELEGMQPLACLGVPQL
jgi:hypothetical protein